jgi:type III secretory pathway component EscU
MSNLAATITVIGATLTIVTLAVGLQTFWISRSIGRVEIALKETRDELKTEIKETRTELKAEIKETREQVGEVKDVLLRDYGERIARLEALDR